VAPRAQQLAFLTLAASAAPVAPAQPNENGEPAPRLRRQIVDYPTDEASGTIIVDTPHTYLYYVLGNGKAIRYGIGVGRKVFTWSGVRTVVRNAEWPDWCPPSAMIERQPYLPRMMAGGPGNPLGARAMNIGGTEHRIHGTNDPSSIGKFMSSGCIRIANDKAIDLYSRVRIGTKVIVLPMHGAPVREAKAKEAAWQAKAEGAIAASAPEPLTHMSWNGQRLAELY
jgi:lipoprotein-anchoring transpeptidase ErfK/SrfK